jgi:hypothetical protein
MRLLKRLVIAIVLLVGSASVAQAVTLKDLIDLKKAGLSDAVLLALIDSDGTVFKLTATEVRTLRDAGFSDKLIISILGTSAKGREEIDAQAAAVQDLWAAQAALPPQPLVEPVPGYPEHLPVVLVETPTFATYPWYSYPLVGSTYGNVRATTQPGDFMFRGQSQYRPPEPARPQQLPTYWGFGGQRRPDTWQAPGPGIKR